MKPGSIRRRDFLRIAVVSAVAAGAAPLTGCGDSGAGDSPAGSSRPRCDSSRPEDVLQVFPQGIASGDPNPESVLLWTRVSPDSAGAATPSDVVVFYEVALDEQFENLVSQGEVSADASADNTIRLKVTGLEAFTTYYYRFIANGVCSEVGRTKTAPAEDQDVSVRFAFASCQDFVGRFYHAWKALADEEAVDFVVFLGDYIYETDGDPSFMTPTDARKIVLPDGLAINTSTRAATTLADYRSLYQQYRSDPDIRRAHRLFPFVCIWDDHEFANDCWQDRTNHFDGAQGDEKNTEQRQAADRAWFEYQAADVEYDAAAQYPDDIRIYRKLRFGRHMELFLTDQRYYRSDHIVPEGPANLGVAKFLENSAIGSRIFVLKKGFDPLEAAANPTMLGSEQKAWLVDAIRTSSATWKVWGSETQLAQMSADLSSFSSLPAAFQDRFYLTVDQWDGYRTERAQILSALDGVENLVVVTGDIHAFYASELYVDFDAPSDTPVGVEYVTAGISSQAIAPAAQSVLSSNDTFNSLGLLELIPRFDELLVQASPHYKHANSWGNGIAVCQVERGRIEVEFLVVADVTSPSFDGSLQRVKFRTLAGTPRISSV